MVPLSRTEKWGVRLIWFQPGVVTSVTSCWNRTSGFAERVEGVVEGRRAGGGGLGAEAPEEEEGSVLGF